MYTNHPINFQPIVGHPLAQGCAIHPLASAYTTPYATYPTQYVNPYATSFQNPFINSYVGAPVIGGSIPGLIDPFYSTLNRGLVPTVVIGSPWNQSIPAYAGIQNTIPGYGIQNTIPGYAAVPNTVPSYSAELPLPYLRYSQVSAPLGVNPYVQGPVSTINGVH